ncbi:MAG: NRDE family protein [Desulfobacteraceae bacterium]
MCLIVLGLEAHPEYRLVLAANRDEFYERPSAPAEFWKEAPEVLAGRDLKGGGTWTGVTRTGKIALLTNFRDPASRKENPPSRGLLVSDYLMGGRGPVEFLQQLSCRAHLYDGFNLILGRGAELYWYSNRGGAIRRIEPGVHGLSNHLLNTPWPKVRRAKGALARILSGGSRVEEEDLFRLLADRTRPLDRELPSTGMPLDWERILSPVFIVSPTYGTRSSTLLFLDRQGTLTFVERTHDPGAGGTVRYSFAVPGASGSPVSSAV